MTLQSLPLVRSLHRALLERGAWPLIRLAPGELAPDFYRHARAAQLDAYPALELIEAEAADAFITITAPANARALASVDPELIARAGRARAPIHEARLTKRWCGTLWPTPALAQQAAMGDDEYAAFVSRAMFLDRDDPIAAWYELAQRQQLLVERLAPARRDQHRGRRHGPEPARRRSHVDQLRRQAQHAERRGLHRPDRGLGERHDPLHGSLQPARRRGHRRGAAAALR